MSLESLFLQLWRNLIIHAVTRLCWLKDDSLSTSMRESSITIRVQTAVFNSSPSWVILAGESFLGHFNSCTLSHDGPFHHKSWARSSEGNKPRDAQLAGLSSTVGWNQLQYLGNSIPYIQGFLGSRLRQWWSLSMHTRNLKVRPYSEIAVVPVSMLHSTPVWAL